VHEVVELLWIAAQVVELALAACVLGVGVAAGTQAGERLIAAEDLDLVAGNASEAPLNLKSAREHADRNVIRHALARSEGNISNTARLLGISRPTLYDLLKQYDLHA